MTNNFGRIFLNTKVAEHLPRDPETLGEAVCIITDNFVTVQEVEKFAEQTSTIWIHEKGRYWFYKM